MSQTEGYRGNGGARWQSHPGDLYHVRDDKSRRGPSSAGPPNRRFPSRMMPIDRRRSEGFVVDRQRSGHQVRDHPQTRFATPPDLRRTELGGVQRSYGQRLSKRERKRAKSRLGLAVTAGEATARDVQVAPKVQATPAREAASVRTLAWDHRLTPSHRRVSSDRDSDMTLPSPEDFSGTEVGEPHAPLPSALEQGSMPAVRARDRAESFDSCRPLADVVRAQREATVAAIPARREPEPKREAAGVIDLATTLVDQERRIRDLEAALQQADEELKLANERVFCIEIARDAYRGRWMALKALL